MAALMHQRVILVYTHDSIGLGEDGPTHQPIEHVASLRADAEPQRLAALRCGRDRRRLAARRVERDDGPTCLVLTRQALPQQPRTREQRRCTSRAAATCCSTAPARPKRMVIATGSEVALAVEAVRGAERRRAGACGWCRCPAPTCSTRRTPPGANRCCPRRVTRRVAIEAGATALWWRYVGSAGRVHRHRQIRRLGQGAGPVQALRPDGGQRARADYARIVRLKSGISLDGGIDHGYQGWHQWLRPHRPQHPARALRGEAHAAKSRSWPSTTWATRKPMRT